jgi:hypothetical protein
VFSLTYVSSATMPLTPAQLRALLETCNRRNRQRDVTGMLLYKDGNFMQVLEGEEPSVKAVHETIARDPRHRGLITLLQGTTPGRQFAAWSMGFKDLSAVLEGPEGYSDFLHVPLTGKEFESDPSKAQKLLLSFKKSM